MCVCVCVFRVRLRKKTWKNPGTVFLDYHVYEEDISISSNWEVFLEVLNGNTAVSYKLVIVLLRSFLYLGSCSSKVKLNVTVKKKKKERKKSLKTLVHTER